MNNGAWKPEEEDFVLQNYKTMSPEEMADHLCSFPANIPKSATAVQLYMHRHRLAISTVKRNLIIELLTLKFVHPQYFTPTKDFYKAVKMSSARWWDLYYGRKMATQEEYIIIAIHFNVSLQEAFESRQLQLFDTEKND